VLLITLGPSGGQTSMVELVVHVLALQATGAPGNVGCAAADSTAESDTINE